MVDFNKKIINSNKFRLSALRFKESGSYCMYPSGTSEYMAFWDEEKRRCLNGYTAEDGDYITGYNYFYLNYCPIERIVYEDVTDRFGKTEKKRVRKVDFPDFYDYDYYYFMAILEAEDVGKHMCVLKSRRKGFSYKNASLACRNYYMIPNSKSYIYASDLTYLLGDGTMSKVTMYMSFIDKNTAFSKKKSVNKSLHKRAGFFTKDEFGNEIEVGYKSEIIAKSLKDDPSGVRGKAGKLIIFEEAGSFSELGAAWSIARPSVEQDGIAFGLMIAFGTGGDDKGNNFTTLKDMFYHPKGYNCLPFKNIWDDGATENCGFFCPLYTNLANRNDAGERLYMDEDGNTKRKEALEYVLSLRREVINNASNSLTVDRYCAENCITPAEACLNFNGNIFPKKDLQQHLAAIRTNRSLLNHKQVGDLVFKESGELQWIPKKVGDITHYPLEKEDDPTGSIVIWEHPAKDASNGLYIAGIDSYDYDESSTTSLGSCIIYKRFLNFEAYSDIIVAEYTGRPKTAEDFYENVRKLLIYYNARAMYENQNKGIFVYFTNKHCDYLLADQPDIINDIVGNSKVQRKKGCHMNKLIKQWGEGLIKDWLNGLNSAGKKNLYNILSEPLLEELIAYSDTTNTDRCLTKGTLITTNCGYKPVEDIEVTDMVLTHNGVYKPVTWIDKHEHNGNIVTLKCSGDYLELTCTDNHPILVKYTNKRAHCYRNIDSLTTDFVRADSLNHKYQFAFLPKRNIENKSQYTPQILYLMGWILGDGFCSKTSNEVKITYQLNQLDCAKQCKSIIEKFDNEHECKLFKDKFSNCYRLLIFSKKLHDFAVNFGCISNNKLLSYKVYNSTTELIPFVLGLLEADGHLKLNANYDGCVRNAIEISTIYHELLRQCRQILIDNGIYSTLRLLKQRNGKQLVSLLISGNYVHDLLLFYKIYNIQSYKFELITKRNTNNIALKDESGFWVPIKLLRVDSLKNYVYNFEVLDDHTYVSNGILTHNCMALMQIMIYRELLYNVVVKEKEKQNKNRILFDGPIFAQSWFEDDTPSLLFDDNVYTF